MKDDNFIGDIEIWKENFKEALNNKQIYLFCGSAIEACINYMFLLELGVMAKVYIGSMSEWVLDDTVQTKQGEE